MPSEKDLLIARQAAQKAAEIILEHYEKLEAMSWAPPEITTATDRQAQDGILEYLSQHFPEDGFCAEEKTPLLTRLQRQAKRVWIIDPIDGTRGFVLKNGEFATLIALVEEGEPVLGLILEPAENRLTWAVRKQGCWTQVGDGPAKKCSVSQTAELRLARLVRSRGESGDTPKPPLLPVAEQIYCYSAGRKLAMVARGEADLYTSLYPGFFVWDICAGQVLVTEAGGRLTDACGQEISYLELHRPVHGVLAANPILYEQALTFIKPRMIARLRKQT